MNLLLVADKENLRYYSLARACINNHTVFTSKVTYPTITPYLLQCKREHIDAIIVSHSALLNNVVTRITSKTSKDNYSLQKWAGSILTIEGIDIIVARPFKQLATVDYSRYLLKWYIRKLQFKEYYTPPPMEWSVCDTHSQRTHTYNLFKDAEVIAVDIETMLPEVNRKLHNRLIEESPAIHGLAVEVKQKAGKPSKLCIPSIDIIGYTAIFKGVTGKLYSKTIVLHIKSMDDIYWIRKFNSLEPTKICQNGGYEATNLIRYNAPLKNWLADTFHMAHCQYAELPRTLADLASFWMGNFMYWKDEITTQRAHYNAKDTYTTAWIWIFQVREMQQYAKDNYLIEFRKCFPAITSGLEGFRVDHYEQLRLWQKYNAIKIQARLRLRTLLGEWFNPDSPTQLLPVLNAFTKFKLKKTDKKALLRWSESGNLQAYIAELIKEYRVASKKVSTYLECSLFDGRMLYEINHGGTDTGRASSKSSNLWCGTNIQNQDNRLRSMYTADTIANGAKEDWVLANQDGSQAESRTTGYISEDANLINAVETAPDFHARNASMFFGIPEDEIIKVERDIITNEVVKVTVLMPALRKLSKPVNHGSNYNMGAAVLLETMGTKSVLEAKRLLHLPNEFSIIDTCNYLLGAFVRTYPDIKGKYYDEVFEEIATTGKLVGATGWTRVCFGKPTRDGHKPTINKYVAHQPQSLSVMIIDEAEFDFWYKYQIQKNLVRIKAQVHDEVVYQCRPKDLKETQEALGALINRPYNVRGRELVIPTDGGGNGYRWSDLK